MSSPFDAIDLGALPPPPVLEPLGYETILAALEADFRARWPGFDALLESDPAVKLLEVAAWRELLWRARVNDAAKAVMLATAVGADLDQLAALLGVARRVIDPGDPDARPAIPPTLESDASLRRRAQLSTEARTAAGTAGRYLFYALGAHPDVADAAVTSPAPGQVLVTILSRLAGGQASAQLLDAVRAVVTAPDIRQLCDTVTVAAAALVPVTVTATLTVRPGPGSEVVRAAAQARAAALFATPTLGRDLARSAVFAALHVEGVEAVALAAPAADVAVTPTQAATLAALAVTVAP